MNRQHHNMIKRQGFTLLELLIVVAIVGTLMSLSVVVMYGFVNQAEEEATSATIQKINRLLEERIDAFDRAFKGTRKDVAIRNMRAVLADPDLNGDQSDGIFGVKDAVVEILAKKALFRFEFPQRIDERLLFGDPEAVVSGVPTGIPESIFLAIAGPNARQQLVTGGNAAPTEEEIRDKVIANLANHLPETESAELLYFALIKSASFGVGAVDSDRFTQNEVRDTDGDGLPEFIDAWGQPLRYYRWPTRLIDVNPPVPFQPDLANTNDPTDVLVNIDTNSDGTPDTIIGTRQITSDERSIASLLLKGLPPAPSMLPNNAMPRDLLLIDPDDPVGRLYAELEHLNGTNGKPTLAVEFNEAKYHTPDTFHAPLVVSAGPDGVLGLYEPHDTGNFGNLAAYNSTLTLSQMVDAISDNITSRNKLSGGRQ